MNDPINLDPIEPTRITPNLTAIPLVPTVWDDLPDGQYAVTPNGCVWQRRRGLWWPAPWWQTENAEQIKAVCSDPDSWAYNNGWPRKMVEDAHGPLEPITLPSEGYPHSDERCRQDSVDADGFTEACRQIARLADALGITGAQSIGDVVDAAVRRVGGERCRSIRPLRHESDCDWVTNNSWCNCGLDDAFEAGHQAGATEVRARVEALCNAAERHADTYKRACIVTTGQVRDALTAAQNPPSDGRTGSGEGAGTSDGAEGVERGEG